MKLYLLSLFSLLISACAKDDGIAVYRVPKEDEAVVTAAPMGAEPGDAGSGPVRWDAPKSWKSEPASGMRLASYLVPGAGGQSAEVSVVALPGDAGGDLANVNRWRGQLGLEPIDESGLSRQAQRRKSPAGELLLVDFAAPGKGRMVAARLNSGGQAWFFKLTGPEAIVASAKPAFEGFLRSLHEAH